MAITVATGWPRTSVTGDLRCVLYKLTVGVTGDTLSLNGVSRIRSVLASTNSNLTGLAATDRSGSTAAYLTFTGTGTDVFVQVLGQ